MESLKEQKKPIAENNKELLMALETMHQEVDGVLYHIDDQEDGVMNTYNELGEFISSRRLRPDERQASIFNLQISKEA